MRIITIKYYFVFCCLIFLSLTGFSQEIDNEYQNMIERKYDFPVITPDSLTALLKNSDQFTLLDTREEKEYEVSHLPEALCFGYDEKNYDLLNDLDTNQLIIVYCSIGVRSQNIAKELKQRGYQNVLNLYGGIFLWADQFRPMVTLLNEDTDTVHGYNKYWGRWIKNAPVTYD